MKELGHRIDAVPVQNSKRGLWRWQTREYVVFAVDSGVDIYERRQKQILRGRFHNEQEARIAGANFLLERLKEEAEE